MKKERSLKKKPFSKAVNSMNMPLIISLCIIVVTASVVALILYTLMILVDVRKMLKPVDKMINEFHGEFKPLIKDFSGITSTVNSFLARLDRIAGLFLGKLDMMAQGSEKAMSYLQKVMQNPKVEISSIGAGIKKGIEVLFKTKGEKDGKD
jgi:hypothetical protein